jgi:hypothetical protein
MGRGGAAPAAASASSVAPPLPAVLANQRKSSDTKSSVATSAAALAAGISIQETYWKGDGRRCKSNVAEANDGDVVMSEVVEVENGTTF